MHLYYQIEPIKDERRNYKRPVVFGSVPEKRQSKRMIELPPGWMRIPKSISNG